MSKYQLPAVLATAAAAVLMNAVLAVPASADPTQSWTFHGSTSDPLRATLAQNYDGSGYKIYIRYPINCSRAYDKELYRTTMPPGWNDEVSAVRDSKGCDVKLYMDYYGSPAQTGWINDTTGFDYVGGFYNDKTSAYNVS